MEATVCGKSLKHIYAQIIDDTKRITIAAACDAEINVKKKNQLKLVRKSARWWLKSYRKRGKGRFDRGGAKYHGRIKAAAEGAREVGFRILL